MKADRHIPIFEYKTMQDFLDNGPINCEIVSVEVDGKPIETYTHPERAIYLFGGEDKTLPVIKGDRVRIDTERCLNMSVSASIVMYDRRLKANWR
jgi:tRNA(Leu) C34 or U34 (ribose-2'-O)-methylase TrmL